VALALVVVLYLYGLVVSRDVADRRFARGARSGRTRMRGGPSRFA
jgi:hypothetical protein